MCDGVRQGDFPAGTIESVLRKHFISANVKSKKAHVCVCVSVYHLVQRHCQACELCPNHPACFCFQEVYCILQIY